MLTTTAEKLVILQSIMHRRRYYKRHSKRRYGDGRVVETFYRVPPNYGDHCPSCGFIKSRGAEVCFACAGEARRR